MDQGLVGLAFAAGLVAALNPCGFAMLPAYLLLVVRGRPGDSTAASQLTLLVRAAAATVGMAGGFLTVFAAFAALTISVAASVQKLLPYATLLVGFVLVMLGIWLLAGRELTMLTPQRLGVRWAATVHLASMYGYGISYAIASLSCTIGPFLAVTGAALRGRSVLGAAAVYLAYVAGLTLVVGALAIAAATASSTVVDRLRKVLPLINRLSGVLLILIGAYVSYYALYEVRLFGSNMGHPSDGVITTAGRLQGTLAAWVLRNGAWPWCFGLIALTAGAIVGKWLRRARR